mmetsp:Transcript_35593/g.36298  ORF Transcript_35593/g.36298 Transcript_35593/m.36298 type:complete len:327 (-) Transcript_35593:8-988(-)
MLRRVAVGTFGIAGWKSVSSCLAKDEDGNRVVKIAERLKPVFPAEKENENVIFRKETKDGIKIFSPKAGSLGLPNCRIATCDILAPIDEVSSLWMSQDRVTWEKNTCQTSQMIENPMLEIPVYYVLYKPSYIAPSRDIAFTIKKLPGGIIGVNDYRANVFVAVDHPESVPKSNFAVRSHMNSILILEPKTAGQTKATYIIEVNDGGWFHSSLIEFIADNYINTLSGLKQELEKSELQQEKNLSIEEVAKLRFQRHQDQLKKLHSTSIVDDITSTKEDLIQTLKILEIRYQNLCKTEKNEGIQLNELKTRVQTDLIKTKERLKAMEK